MRGDQPGHTCASAGTPAYTQECARPCTWGQRGTGGRTSKKSWGTFSSSRPPVHLRRLSEEASSSALPPQLGAVVPNSLPGASGSPTCCPTQPQARGICQAHRGARGPGHSARLGSSYCALGAGFEPGERAPAGWRAGGRAPPARPGAQALLPRGRLCGECSSTDCRRRTSRSSQSVSGSSPFSTARRSDRLLAGGNST